ncbi:MAG: hypothetical protein OEY80_11220 [Nitrospirota bacterium]|nr:hypothetical protein [Nitrospirota bacterium]MDH4359729.1 hypothetical protein [Nitrospirota bacterium]MDH5576046.1 hypothetical protein [Nitrospirota bacterium]
MEINNFPPPTIIPAHSTSTVEDGDVGQKGSFYSRTRKNKKKNMDQHSEEPTPRIDGSTRLIDIRV